MLLKNFNIPMPKATWNMRLLCRVRGSSILAIWKHIIFMVAYATVIVCLHNYVNFFKMKFPIYLVFVLGAVTSLLLVFRTTTAYDRYWEGRCLYSKMVHHIRSLTRVIWAGVQEPQEEDAKVKNLIEKLSTINLLVAFAYATKNYLREEYSYDEHDLKDLIGHLPRFRKVASSSSSSNQLNNLKTTDVIVETPGSCGGIVAKKAANQKRKLSLSTSSSSTSIGAIPHDGDGGVDERKTSMFSLKAHDYHVPTNIPIEISYFLFSYFKNLRKNGTANNTNVGLSYWSISVLIECLTGFERILRTPIPIAYSCHLRQCVWIYLLATPYQLVGNINWWTIPAVGLASFAFLGILRIGREIENPFGYDDNDLPLDDFCKVIRQEIQVIVGNHMSGSLDSWILSKNNCPMAPFCEKSAQELSQMSLSDLRLLMAKGAEIDGDFLPEPVVSGGGDQ